MNGRVTDLAGAGLTPTAVFFVKRSISPGYRRHRQHAVYKDNTMMLFGDAKKMTEEIVRAMA